MRAPEAMAVATATPDAEPSVRMVLMKQFDERGFVFFTNYESRKGQELLANPRPALLFSPQSERPEGKGRSPHPRPPPPFPRGPPAPPGGGRGPGRGGGAPGI